MRDPPGGVTRALALSYNGPGHRDRLTGKDPRVPGPTGAVERRVHVHVENSRRSAPVFDVTPELFAAAAARHPAVAPRVDVTFGQDLEGFDAAMRTAEVLIGWRLPREDLRARAPRLRWIHLKGAGVEHLLPLDWVPSGLTLTNNRGVHAPKAGEFLTMAILMLNHAVPALVSQQRERRWAQRFTTAVAGKTVVVVGVGEMGGVAARRAKALGLRVLGVRRSRRPHRWVDEMYGPDELARVLPRADFLIVTAPLTSATRGLVGRRELDLLPPGAGVVNLGRAAVVDYGALAEKLRGGGLGGAILDVFDPEPLPPDSPLWSTPNLLITPHVSSDDAQQYIPRTLDLFFDNLARYLAGRPLRNRVSLAREY
jgi:phosphoglycerate dehydrogenase-like enzyme